MKDTGKPMEIKWYNDSYMEMPVYKDLMLFVKYFYLNVLNDC
ncbi:MULTISPECIES: hypothetical protein [unclassified Chryseobacterium]|nr:MULTISPECIES: hypothetical protein [unclassified Chryseobacterium]